MKPSPVPTKQLNPEHKDKFKSLLAMDESDSKGYRFLDELDRRAERDLLDHVRETGSIQVAY